MHCLRLFIVVLQELHCLLHVCMIRVRGFYDVTKFRLYLLVSEIAKCIA